MTARNLPAVKKLPPHGQGMILPNLPCITGCLQVYTPNQIVIQTGTILTVAFSPDGTRIATGSSDTYKTVRAKTQAGGQKQGQSRDPMAAPAFHQSLHQPRFLPPAILACPCPYGLHL